MLSSDDADELIADIEEGMREEQRKRQASPTIVVYCDKHLGVKMVRAASLMLSEYGQPKADANPQEFLRCPKEPCERCYDLIFGYHWRGGGMGSHIEQNPDKQPRC